MGDKKRGRPLKSWDEVQKEDMKEKGIDKEWVKDLVQDQKGWRDAMPVG